MNDQSESSEQPELRPARPSAEDLATQWRKRPIFELPGLAAISLYLLVLGGVIILGVAGGHYPALFLLMAAAFIAASGGLFFLFRWAWALSMAAVVLLACYYGWIFAEQRMGPAAVQGLLNVVFFLYLIRTEVRIRLR